jgi:hypothetical protein
MHHKSFYRKMSLSITLATSLTSKKNIITTSSPLVSDDISLGYSIGSEWINETNGKIFRCVDNSEGAALWLQITNISALVNLGTWNASTNSPTLVDAVGVAGNYYTVSVAGSVDFGAGSIAFTEGDWVYCNNDILWSKFETGVAYVPEDVANKATDFTTLDDTLYPSVQATSTEIAAQITAEGLGTMATQNANAVAITGGSIDGTIVNKSLTRALLSANLQLTSTSTNEQVIDLDNPWSVLAEDTPASGRSYIIRNINGSYISTFKNFAGTTIGTVYPESSKTFTYNSTDGWLEGKEGSALNAVHLGAYAALNSVTVGDLYLTNAAITNYADTNLGISLQAGRKLAVTGGISASDLTASELLATGASKEIETLAVATYPSKAEIVHVKGVTSAIQTQFAGKLENTVAAVGGLIAGATQDIYRWF